MHLKQSILLAAIELAKTRGFHRVSRRDVARVSGAATGTINYHFCSMDGLRMAVMKEAVKTQVLEIIAQGLAQRHPVALKAPEILRKKAARHLI